MKPGAMIVCFLALGLGGLFLVAYLALSCGLMNVSSYFYLTAALPIGMAFCFTAVAFGPAPGGPAHRLPSPRIPSEAGQGLGQAGGVHDPEQPSRLLQG